MGIMHMRYPNGITAGTIITITTVGIARSDYPSDGITTTGVLASVGIFSIRFIMVIAAGVILIIQVLAIHITTIMVDAITIITMGITINNTQQTPITVLVQAPAPVHVH
jgi:hypothetical protein